MTNAGEAATSSKNRFGASRRVLTAALSRSIGAALVLVALTSLVFLALRVLPGDPAALVLGDEAPESARAVLRARLGLDRSLFAQYVGFVAGLVTGNLGESLSRPGVAAFAEVFRALVPTAALAGVSVTLGAVAGVVAAVFAVGPWLGAAREWIHRAMIVVAAAPLVAFAPIVTFFFAVRTRLVPLPGDPESGLAGLLFAAGLLALPLAAQVGRMGRAALLDQVRAKYLDVARAKGASAVRVWVVHALPVASAPIAVVVATQLGALLGGAVVLERLFERPGLGTLMLNAYAARDIPVLEASVAAAGFCFVVAQGAAAAVAAVVDPRGHVP